MFNSNLSKKITYLSSVFLLTFAALTGCEKETAQNVDNPISKSLVQDRSEMIPEVVHGMLHFSSFNELNGFTKSLQDKESNSEQVRNAYEVLGIDVNAETLPNLTDHPICLLAEQSLSGFSSARKAEETQINAALNSGDDNIHSVVVYPYWKTALNSDHSVHVGNRIYKYFDNGGIAIVLNNDWALYESISAKPFDELHESFNLMITSDAREGWDKIFIFNADQSISEEKAVFLPRFSAEVNPQGKAFIKNSSLIESPDLSSVFEWIYADNTTSNGLEPNKAISPNEKITLVISHGDGFKETLTGMESILACSVENFTITYLANNQVRFELPGYNQATSQYNLRWLFSFSTSSTSNPVVKTVTSNGTVTCQFFRKNDNTLACQFTKNVEVKCGDKKIYNETFIFDENNQRWKLDGTIWVQSGEVGCKVKYLRWRGIILGWRPANNEGSCAFINGTYLREVYNPNKNCMNVYANGNNCLGEGTYPTTVFYTIPETPNVFSSPNQLKAKLGINISGTWRGWGYANKPQLILP